MFVCGRDQGVPELRGIFYALLNVSIATKHISTVADENKTETHFRTAEFKEPNQNSFRNSLILPH